MTTDGEGRGDLGRRLDLLWRAERRPRRGPKPALSLDRIVAAAIELADAEGLAALSMGRLATQLGVATMALYRYVPGKGQLIDLMLDAIFALPPARADAGDWRSELERWAKAAFAIYCRHPWTLQAPITGPPLGPNQLAWLEFVLSVIAGRGLAAGEMIAVALLLSSYAHGTAQIAVGVADIEPQSGAGGEHGQPISTQLLARLRRAGRYPTLAAVLASGGFDADDDRSDGAFAFGLQRILDGIDALIQARAAPAESPDPPSPGR